MDRVLAAVVLAVVTVTFFGVLRFLGYAASGRLKPLVSLRGHDDPAARAPVVFLEPFQEAAQAYAQFERHRGTSCAMHDRPYCAVSVFRLVRPSGAFDPGWTGETLLGRCYLLSCQDCVAEAYRWRAFAWTRENQVQHPAWASAALYPFLLKKRYLELDDDVARPIWDGVLPERPVPLAERVEGLQARLADLSACGDGISVAPDLSADALRAVLRAVNQKVAPSDLLLADRIVAVRKGIEGFALSSEAFYDVSGKVRRTSFEAMSDLALSAHGLDVVAGGRKLTNPFSKLDRRRRFAAALHGLLADLRAQSGSSGV
jgi:hypothetical protein